MADKLTITIETSEETGIVIRMDGVIGIKEMTISAAMLSAHACEMTDTSPVDFLTLFLDARKMREEAHNGGGAV